jgi:hypothetical protein
MFQAKYISCILDAPADELGFQIPLPRGLLMLSHAMSRWWENTNGGSDPFMKSETKSALPSWLDLTEGEAWFGLSGDSFNKKGGSAYTSITVRCNAPGFEMVWMKPPFYLLIAEFAGKSQKSDTCTY